MSEIPVSKRAARIEYAIRDVVVPAIALEAEGHEIIKLNIGDPIAYPGLPTPDLMIQAFPESLFRIIGNDFINIWIIVQNHFPHRVTKERDPCLGVLFF